MNAKYRQGWRDRMGGKTWHKQYDQWNCFQQYDYETGRRAAAAAQGFGLHNKEPITFDAPLKVVRTINEENLL